MTDKWFWLIIGSVCIAFVAIIVVPTMAQKEYCAKMIQKYESGECECRPYAGCYFILPDGTMKKR